jgi:hypothetical protein
VFSKPKKRVATDSEKAVIGTLIRHQDGEKLQMVLSNVKYRVAVKDRSLMKKLNQGRLEASGKFDTVVLTNQRAFALSKKDEPLTYRGLVRTEQRKRQIPDNKGGTKTKIETVTVITPQMMVFSPDFIFGMVGWARDHAAESALKAATQDENEGIVKKTAKAYGRFYKTRGSTILHPLKVSKEAAEIFVRTPGEWFELTDIAVGQKGLIFKKPCLKLTAVHQSVYDWISRGYSSPSQVKEAMGTPVDLARLMGKFGTVVSFLSGGPEPNYEIRLMTDQFTQELYDAIKTGT